MAWYGRYPTNYLIFNVGYLLDVLNNISAEEVQWSFNDANSSALISIPGNDRFKYVVMPMRI
jgi:DNA polymerase-3 subunit beta